MNPVAYPDVARVEEDGTLTAIVTKPAQPFAGAGLLTIELPAGLPSTPLAGRYFLARCGAQSAWERAEQWQIYLRRPLFVAGWRVFCHEDGLDEWRLQVPNGADPGYGWLRSLGAGESVNLVGPLGNGFALAPQTRHLLLLTDLARVAALLPLVDTHLDRGGKVTIALQAPGPIDERLRDALPLAVEFHQAGNTAEWETLLAATIPWADQIAGWLPTPTLPALASQIRARRLRLEPGFALVTVDADLACGYGACLACVVPLAHGNLTRACVHGPVFDLAELVAGDG
jgi:dihydroorotate dehydrogenase electron transfer subunit